MAKAWLRDWRRHPLQRLLTLLGVVLAIAVVLAVDLANQAAQRAFDRSLEEIAGTATHQILGPAHGFDDQFYTSLRRVGWRDLAPVVEGPLRLPDGATVYLLGVDPLAEAPFRETAAGFGTLPIQRLLTEPGTVLVPESSWQRWATDAETASVRVTIPVNPLGSVGSVELHLLAAPAAAAGAQVWITDIATAQVLLDRVGRLDRIDALLTDPERISELVATLPPGFELLEVGQRDAAAREMAQAFRINLTAMSLLTLLIAAFLIYNTQTFSVLRRREVLVSLRLLGAQNRHLTQIVLFEALLVGILGTLIGTLLGIMLAQGLVAQVARTVSDHFFVVSVTTVEPRPLALAATLLLGIGLSLAAAWAPAWEAGRTQGLGTAGRAVFEYRSRGVAYGLFWFGWALLGSSALLMMLTWGGLIGGFIALFLLIFGFLLLLPQSLVWLLRWAGKTRWVRLGPALYRLAGRALERSLSRSGPALVALTLSLAGAIGVSVLVDSFRFSVSAWLSQTLTSDVYLIPVNPPSARGASLLPMAWIDTWRAHPEVTSVSAATTLETMSEVGLVKAFILSPHADWLEYLPLQGRGIGASWRTELAQRMRTEDLVLITEGFAAHHGLRAGDSLELTTPTGRRNFAIAGVYRDYSSPRGKVLILAERYYLNSIQPGVGAMGLRVPDDPDATEQAVLDWLRDQTTPALTSRPEKITAESLEIFDRTFAVTHLLRLITLFVAFVAILSALVALQMERSREYAVLRTLGLQPAGVARLVGLQGLLLGLFAAVAAVPLGLGMGWVLIEVINREAFGWRMDFQLPVVPVLENLALGVGAALLASVYPSWRLARMPIVPALRGS